MKYPEDLLMEMPVYKGDRAGVNPPLWARSAVVYQVYVRDFSSEGNFQGLIRGLDRIRELGADVIWLMPIHPIGIEGRKGELGCPYAVRDYFDINPEYGTHGDFRELVEEVHRRGMKIIIDMVINHSSPDAVHLQDNPGWCHSDEMGQPARRFEEWSDVADLNYGNSQLRAYILDALLYWVREFDVDGYRCDVAGMVPLGFWKWAVKELRAVKPDIFMLAEWEDPNLCVSCFNSDYHGALYRGLCRLFQGKATACSVSDIISSTYSIYPRNYLPFNFIENHDQKRSALVFGEKGYRPVAVLIFTLPGIPLIYNGQEMGEIHYPSLFQREPIPWEMEKTGFFDFYKDLISLRMENSVFSRGRFIPLSVEHPDKVMAYTVMTEKETGWVFLNFSTRSLNVKVHLPRYITSSPERTVFSTGSSCLRECSKPDWDFMKERHITVNLDGYGALVAVTDQA